jgi:hypothetical protein
MTVLDNARSASNNAADTRDTIQKLGEMGFGDDAFAVLHHFEAR